MGEAESGGALCTHVPAPMPHLIQQRVEGVGPTESHKPGKYRAWKFMDREQLVPEGGEPLGHFCLPSGSLQTGASETPG